MSASNLIQSPGSARSQGVSVNGAALQPNPLPSQGRGGFCCRWFQTAPASANAYCRVRTAHHLWFPISAWQPDNQAGCAALSRPTGCHRFQVAPASAKSRQLHSSLSICHVSYKVSAGHYCLNPPLAKKTFYSQLFAREIGGIRQHHFAPADPRSPVWSGPASPRR
jgi:hypothetical protein